MAISSFNDGSYLFPGASKATKPCPTKRSASKADLGYQLAAMREFNEHANSNPAFKKLFNQIRELKVFVLAERCRRMAEESDDFNSAYFMDHSAHPLPHNSISSFSEKPHEFPPSFIPLFRSKFQLLTDAYPGAFLLSAEVVGLGCTVRVLYPNSGGLAEHDQQQRSTAGGQENVADNATHRSHDGDIEPPVGCDGSSAQVVE